MITAIVLLKAERGQAMTVGELVAGLEGVSEVYSVAGRYDLVALFRVASMEELANTVASQLHKIAGIVETETMVALQAYSRDAMEALFSVGYE